VTPFTTYNLNYPVGVNLWNTWMPALGLAVGLVSALGGAVLAKNVTTTAGLALAALFAGAQHPGELEGADRRSRHPPIAVLVGEHEDVGHVVVPSGGTAARCAR
jgi:hypothetical protein